jgi:hypothetical protein
LHTRPPCTLKPSRYASTSPAGTSIIKNGPSTPLLPSNYCPLPLPYRHRSAASLRIRTLHPTVSAHLPESPLQPIEPAESFYRYTRRTRLDQRRLPIESAVVSTRSLIASVAATAENFWAGLPCCYVHHLFGPIQRFLVTNPKLKQPCQLRVSTFIVYT